MEELTATDVSCLWQPVSYNAFVTDIMAERSVVIHILYFFILEKTNTRH